MRLSLSLIFFAVLTLIGASWLFDKWYAREAAASEKPLLEREKKLGKIFVQLIDADNQPIEQWEKQLISIQSVSNNESFSNRQSSSNSQPSEQLKTTTQLKPSLELSSYDDFPIPQNLKSTFETGEPLVLESDDTISIHFFVPHKNKVLSLNFENRQMQSLDPLRLTMTLLFYCLVIAMLAVWAYPLLKRLKLLNQVTHAFGKGDLSVRIATDKSSYIANIEIEFNRMAQQIETLIEDNKLLARGLSHDLRTPLARLRFGVEVLQEGNLDAEQKKTLDHLNRDLTAMEYLIERLLEYARLDQSRVSLQLETIELGKFVQQWLNQEYTDSVTFNNQLNDHSIFVEIDPQFFTQLLHNIIQNAFTYGKGLVRVSLMKKNNCVEISIEDNGDGVSPDEYKQIFKPFYRATTSKKTKGYGLGLAFAERIAHWHRAEINLKKSEELGGLTLIITLPIKTST